jgi:hypothetical protein
VFHHTFNAESVSNIFQLSRGTRIYLHSPLPTCIATATSSAMFDILARASSSPCACIGILRGAHVPRNIFILIQVGLLHRGIPKRRILSRQPVDWAFWYGVGIRAIENHHRGNIGNVWIRYRVGIGIVVWRRIMLVRRVISRHIWSSAAKR